MPIVPGLRSPHVTVRGMVYLPRLIDKVRLHARGALHPDFVPNLGKGFDERCCRYLRIGYAELSAWILANPAADDAGVLAWAESTGRALDDGDIDVWNGFMTKRGWRDDARPALEKRLTEAGLPLDGPVQTFFDYLDFDEGRSLRDPGD